MPYKDREERLRHSKRYHQEHRASLVAAMRDRYPKYAAAGVEKKRAIRRLALAALGGRCQRCGFDDWRALQIDHVEGAGTEERKRQSSGRTIAFEVVKGRREGLQVLCANCNWIKRYERGETGDYLRVLSGGMEAAEPELPL